MKKILLSVSAFLFFVSCSDLSLSNEEALKGGLPADFDWQKYVKINKDVKASQIIFKIQEENKKVSAQEVIDNCGAVLEDLDFASEIYMEYAGCPKKGWNPNERCSGVYANNDAYSVFDATKQAWVCKISDCWSGGWDDPPLFGECEGCEYDGTVDLLTGELELYVAKKTTSFAPINMMCMYISPKAEGSWEKAKNYLETFSLNQISVEQHYFLIGRNEGRPYKYCEQGSYGEEKNRDIHAAKLSGGSGQDKRDFYDYGKHLFCFNESDEKVYVVK